MMKLLVYIGLLYTIAGFANASPLDRPDQNEKRSVLKRVVRNVFSTTSDTDLLQFEAIVIASCKANGHTKAASTLQKTYDDLKICIKKKRAFLTPKSEFLSNIDECSRDAVKKTKECLPNNQKYFPEFLLDLVKSMANFTYDDYNLLHNTVIPCMTNYLSNDGVRRKYVQCLADNSARMHDLNEIPTSKAAFCQKLIPGTYCFTDILKESCETSGDLDKFKTDYVNAMKIPCDKKEN